MPLGQIKITPKYPQQVDTIYVNVYADIIGVFISYDTQDYTDNDIKGFVESFINRAADSYAKYKQLGDMRQATATAQVAEHYKYVRGALNRLPIELVYLDRPDNYRGALHKMNQRYPNRGHELLEDLHRANSGR